jgi:hypothetical protein
MKHTSRGRHHSNKQKTNEIRANDSGTSSVLAYDMESGSLETQTIK